MPFVNKHAGCDDIVCGLVFYLDQLHLPVPVPLKDVRIVTKVVDFVAEVNVIQEYVNKTENPLECVYMFPVEEESAVVDFEAEVDGRVIKTAIKEKQEARQEYNEAIQDEKTAFLLEETKADIFQIKVGHLKPGSGAKITIRYISELPVEDTCVRLTIPTTIAPKYVPPTDNSEAAEKISKIPYSLDTPAKLNVELSALMKNKIKKIASPSHPINVTDSSVEMGKHVSKAVLSGAVTDMDRDLIFTIEAENMHDPVVFLEEDKERGTHAGMLSLVPSFNLKEQQVELIFLVDRSGSMTGSSIEQAKKALLLFLHSMPATCYFNIFSFGSRFDSLFEKSVEYTDQTLEKAKQHANSMEANYGGTEIFGPLKDIYNVPLKPGYVRQVFVLTDGAVSNDNQVISLVRSKANFGRLFSLGLGNSCSRHLVKGIARAGQGTASFAAEGEDLRPKVLSQLKHALQPAVSNVKVEWLGSHLHKDEGPKPKEKSGFVNTLLGHKKEAGSVPLTGQAPFVIPPVFDGSRLLVYRLFDTKEKPNRVVITAETPDGALNAELEIDEKSYIDGKFVHQLAARKKIQDLEENIIQDFDQGKIKAAIVELGKEYNLASSHTSFIGVDPKDNDKQYFGQMMTHEIQNQIPRGFGGFGSPAMMCAAISPGGGMVNAAPCAPLKSMQFQCDSASASSSVRDSVGVGRSERRARSVKKERCMDVYDDYDDADSELNEHAIIKTHKEEQVEEEDSTLEHIIDCQSASGAFRWQENLSKILNLSKDKILEKKPDSRLTDDAWITLTVVAYLEQKMADKKDLWELVVDKARKFVLSKLGESSLNKDIEDAARKMISQE